MNIDIKKIGTEKRNPKTMNIDKMSTEEIVRVINDEDKTVASAVEGAILQITKLVDAIVSAFEKKGRMIYLGAGTSGRIGLIDAVECRPTFSIPDEMVQCARCRNQHKLSERKRVLQRNNWTSYRCPRCNAESYYKIPLPQNTDQ